jgi:hypothetical protein
VGGGAFYMRGREREGVLAVAMANGWRGQASGVTYEGGAG